MDEIDWERRLRDGIEAYNRGDYAAVLAFAADDVVLKRPADAPEGKQTVDGREAVLQFFRPDVFREQYLDLHEVHEGDGALVARITFSATGAGSGMAISLDSFLVYTLAPSREEITRIAIYNEEHEARAAAGLG
jgi:ketosteroid isomerase-like protein